jgi:hypothetical protein
VPARECGDEDAQKPRVDDHHIDRLHGGNGVRRREFPERLHHADRKREEETRHQPGTERTQERHEVEQTHCG